MITYCSFVNLFDLDFNNCLTRLFVGEVSKLVGCRFGDPCQSIADIAAENKAHIALYTVQRPLCFGVGMLKAILQNGM